MDHPKTKHPRAAAIAVAKEVQALIEPHCERLIFAGSLRRRKALVGDVEVLYIPKTETRKIDLIKSAEIDLVAEALRQALDAGIIAPRRGRDNLTRWGDSNKLAIHCPSGIAVDFFRADEERWANMLVNRTGSAANNIDICLAAQAKQWTWQPYGAGFFDEANRRVIRAATERDVYELVGLPYREPWERG